MFGIGTEMDPEWTHEEDEEWMDDGIRKVSMQYSVLLATCKINPKLSQSQ